jgi:hypothetical protein
LFLRIFYEFFSPKYTHINNKLFFQEEISNLSPHFTIYVVGNLLNARKQRDP